MRFMSQIHIIGKNLVQSADFLKFIVSLGKKIHFALGMKITMVLIWYQSMQNFRGMSYTYKLS